MHKFWNVRDVLSLIRSFIPRRFLKLGSVHIIAIDLHSTKAPRLEVAGIRSASQADIDALIASFTTRDVLDRGSQTWVAEQAGELVAYDISGAEAKRISDFIQLKAPERDTWAIHIWVSPAARGQGLAMQLRLRVAAEFRDQGVNRLLGTISATNERSIRAFEKMGAKFIGRIHFAWLCGFAVVWFEGRLRLGYWTGRTPLTLGISMGAK
ncbi:MAG: GNAT family N-acetyltransferase [Boseongicola sp.]